MWPAIRADLRVLANAFATHDGRKALAAAIVGTACIALGAAALLGRLLVARPMREALAQGLPAAHTIVAGVVVFLPAMIAAGLALAQTRRELFESPQATMMLVAPIGRFAVTVRAWVRLSFSGLLFALAVGIAPLIRVVVDADVRPAALACFPLAVIALAAPWVAACMLFHVVRARFFSGPRVRFALQAIGIAGSLGLTAVGLLGLLSSRGQLAETARVLLASGAATQDVAWLPTAWVVRAGGGTGAASWIAWVWPPVATVGLLAIASRFLRGAYERVAIVEPGVVRKRMRRAGRVWPRLPAASIAWKDLCSVVQERGGIVSLVFFFGLQLVLMKTGLYGRAIRGDAVPSAVAHAFGMVVAMQVLSVFLGGIQSLSIVGSERRQLAMLATAPVHSSTVLLGKSVLVALPFAWCAFACLVGGPFVAGAPWAAVVLFVPMACGIILANTGLILLVGTWPPLFSVDEDVPIANSLHSVVPAMLTTVTLGLSIGGTLWLRGRLADAWAFDAESAHAQTTFAVVAVLGVGMVVASAGFALGVRHVQRVFGPRA